MAEYGYIRVSAKDQNEARQVDAMAGAGIAPERVFMDKQSGRDFRRPRYAAMIRRLRKGDTVYIKSIDRLGRNYTEVLEQWRYLTGVRKVDVVVLDMPLLDTRRGKTLLGTFIADLVLQVLSFVAENERVNIKQRQAEGIAAAHARGVKFGRPSKPVPENFEALAREFRAGKIKLAAAAMIAGMPEGTFYQKARQLAEPAAAAQESA